MSKTYNGQIHIRVPGELHEELAREAFERGVSISSLCSQALLMRRALKHVDPWKAIADNWEMNHDADPAQLEIDIRSAVRLARQSKRSR